MPAWRDAGLENSVEKRAPSKRENLPGSQPVLHLVVPIIVNAHFSA
jgi:hypothetical protein